MPRTPEGDKMLIETFAKRAQEAPEAALVVMVINRGSDGGRETDWSSRNMAGGDPEELRSDLGLMLMEAMCWKPVAFDKLKVGMAFTIIASPQVRELLRAVLLGKSGAKRKR